MQENELDGVRMTVVETAPGGVVNAEVVFRFRQAGELVSAEYAGGPIRWGTLVGRLDGTRLEFRYAQLQADGVLDGGRSECEVERGADGRLRLLEHFEWESRQGSGTNVFEELPADDARGDGRLREVQPVLHVRDVARSLEFYRRLGFELAFQDDWDDPRYAGVRRGPVELHLQWHDESEWRAGLDRPVTRFVVDDPDALCEELVASGACERLRPTFDTPWGTREFHVLDPDGNGLQFYRDR